MPYILSLVGVKRSCLRPRRYYVSEGHSRYDGFITPILEAYSNVSDHRNITEQSESEKNGTRLRIEKANTGSGGVRHDPQRFMGKIVAVLYFNRDTVEFASLREINQTQGSKHVSFSVLF